jgi:predicted O-methyltransferase YrrM
MVEQQPGCGPPAPVTILQWEKEFEVLLELYRRLKPRRVLEIGTYHGGTLYHWLQNAPMGGCRIVSVDSYAVGVDNRHLYPQWTPPGVELVVIEGESHANDTITKVRQNGFYNFALIDAGHYLAEVTRDWENYRQLVPGGVLCFHDILTHPAWPSIEVGQLWEQIKKDYLTFEIVADRDAEWGGLGVVLL